MITLAGKHVLEEAFNAGLPIKELWISKQTQIQNSLKELITRAERLRIPIRYVSDHEFKSINEKHQHIVGIAPAIPHHSLDAIIEKKPPLIVLIDHLQDPHNFGAILRTCVALGVKAVIYPKDRNCSLSAGVIRASAGAVYFIDLVQVVNLGHALQTLSKSGYWIYATHVETGKPLSELKPVFPLVLIVGNEQKGTSHRLLSLSDERVTIPMAGSWDSLNVSVATGILLYEWTQTLRKNV
jgi:23S rRNA (guanosine2251-2'-O)-methyltransferase